MNTLLLHPNDVLFFRDGRPMTGAASGHGAAWPHPSVVNHALHAALHRADIQGTHRHVPGRASNQRDFSPENRAQKGRLFGCLITAGPFPVDPKGNWFFPRPADTGSSEDGAVTLEPCPLGEESSLPRPLQYTVASRTAPSKKAPKGWWNSAAWTAYLQGSCPNPADFCSESDLADTEHSYGIAISAESGSAVDGAFYSAHYLRLREGWRMGAFAEARDKDLREDLVQRLLSSDRPQILIGGQQRVCSAQLAAPNGQALPLPMAPKVQGTRVKWVLLSPAIWPEIVGDESRGIQPHPGGWLPNWIAAADHPLLEEPVHAGDVLLLDGPGKTKAQRTGKTPGRRIRAKLVAAVVGKPLPISGFAAANAAADDRQEGGSKSTHLAVPAGAVFYFEADNAEAAQKLADALNWHGTGSGTVIQNRRSTLMGEKGFGLGVCGAWNFHPHRSS